MHDATQRRWCRLCSAQRGEDAVARDEHVGVAAQLRQAARRARLPHEEGAHEDAVCQEGAREDARVLTYLVPLEAPRARPASSSSAVERQPLRNELGDRRAVGQQHLA